MNIILVGKPFRTPKTLDLAKRSVQFTLAAVGLGLCTLVVGGSFLIGQFIGDRSGVTRGQVQSLRDQLEAQKTELAEVERTVQNNLNALALELGSLQAQSARLNALGSRLTTIGKLNDGEFDFSSAPALGGPEIEAEANGFLAGEFGRELSALRARFAAQEQQLSLLETLLLDRELDQSLLPKGMPVRSGYISSGFGYRADPFTGRGSMHTGVDFNGPYGSDVLAVAGGVVTWSGVRMGYGNVIDIDHGNGYKTRYAHNSTNLVEVGDRVQAGEVIARMGSSGRATGSHVHFEVWYNDRPINPTEFVSSIR